MKGFLSRTVPCFPNNPYIGEINRYISFVDLFFKYPDVIAPYLTASCWDMRIRPTPSQLKKILEWQKETTIFASDLLEIIKSRLNENIHQAAELYKKCKNKKAKIQILEIKEQYTQLKNIDPLPICKINENFIVNFYNENFVEDCKKREREKKIGYTEGNGVEELFSLQNEMKIIIGNFLNSSQEALSISGNDNEILNEILCEGFFIYDQYQILFDTLIKQYRSTISTFENYVGYLINETEKIDQFLMENKTSLPFSFDAINFTRLDYCFFICCSYLEEIMAEGTSSAHNAVSDEPLLSDSLAPEARQKALIDFHRSFVDSYTLIKKEKNLLEDKGNFLRIGAIENKLEIAIEYANDAQRFAKDNTNFLKKIDLLKSIILIIKEQIKDPFLLSQLLMTDEKTIPSANDEKIMRYLAKAILSHVFHASTTLDNFPLQFSERLNDILALYPFTVPNGSAEEQGDYIIDCCSKILQEIGKIENFVDSYAAADPEEESKCAAFKHKIEMVLPYSELLKSHFLLIDTRKKVEKKEAAEQINNLSIQQVVKEPIESPLSVEELFDKERHEFFAALDSSVKTMRARCTQISLSLASEEGSRADPLKKMHFQQLSWQLMTLQEQSKAYLKQGKITSAQALIYLFKLTVFSEQLCKLSLACEDKRENEKNYLKKTHNLSELIQNLSNTAPLFIAKLSAESTRQTIEQMSGFISVAYRYLGNHQWLTALDEYEEGSVAHFNTIAKTIQGATDIASLLLTTIAVENEKNNHSLVDTVDAVVDGIRSTGYLLPARGQYPRAVEIDKIVSLLSSLENKVEQKTNEQKTTLPLAEENMKKKRDDSYHYYLRAHRRNVKELNKLLEMKNGAELSISYVESLLFRSALCLESSVLALLSFLPIEGSRDEEGVLHRLFVVEQKPSQSIEYRFTHQMKDFVGILCRWFSSNGFIEAAEQLKTVDHIANFWQQIVKKNYRYPFGEAKNRHREILRLFHSLSTLRYKIDNEKISERENLLCKKLLAGETDQNLLDTIDNTIRQQMAVRVFPLVEEALHYSEQILSLII